MRYGDNAVFNLKEFIMNVQTTKTTDDLMVNAELARAIGGKKAQIHLFAGKNGYRIRMLSRDTNAARNILARGHARLAVGIPVL